MLEIIVIAFWSAFAAYAIWYYTSAKHYAPITANEAKILWKIHKENLQCASRKWRILKRKDKIIGFECKCGFKHIQKRPVVYNMPTPNVGTENAQVVALEKLHTSY